MDNLWRMREKRAAEYRAKKLSKEAQGKPIEHSTNALTNSAPRGSYAPSPIALSAASIRSPPTPFIEDVESDDDKSHKNAQSETGSHIQGLGNSALHRPAVSVLRSPIHIAMSPDQIASSPDLIARSPTQIMRSSISSVENSGALKIESSETTPDRESERALSTLTREVKRSSLQPANALKRQQNQPLVHNSRKTKRPKQHTKSSNASSSRCSSVQPHESQAEIKAEERVKKPKKQQQQQQQRRGTSTEDDTSPSELPDLDNPSPPIWYQRLARSITRGRGHASTSNADTVLGLLRNTIRYCEAAVKSGGSPKLEDLARLNDSIHKAMFLPVTAQVVRDNFMLTNESGLPQIFSPRYNQGVAYPYYIKADAAELYTKWWLYTCSTDLFRGILPGKKANVRLGREGNANRLDPKYPCRLMGTFHGNGPLLNGQWWPIQLCALRDGAHHSAQGGIAGRAGEGAWSVTVSGESKYPDRDDGDELLYCGTEGENGQITDNTQLLIQNVNLKLPVRVIRSERCKNETYRPAKGYRYDGLYDVLSYEILNIEKQVHRFKMGRQEGQDPIRNSGPEARPTAEELAAFQQSQMEKVFLV